MSTKSLLVYSFGQSVARILEKTRRCIYSIQAVRADSDEGDDSQEI